MELVSECSDKEPQLMTLTWWMRILELWREPYTVPVEVVLLFSAIHVTKLSIGQTLIKHSTPIDYHQRTPMLVLYSKASYDQEATSQRQHEKTPNDEVESLPFAPSPDDNSSPYRQRNARSMKTHSMGMRWKLTLRHHLPRAATVLIVWCGFSEQPYSPSSFFLWLLSCPRRQELVGCENGRQGVFSQRYSNDPSCWASCWVDYYVITACCSERSANT